MSCHHSSSGGRVSSNTATTSLGNDIKNVQLVAGEQKEISFTYTIPSGATPLTSLEGFSVNLTETMQYVTLSSSPVANKFNLFDKLMMYAAVSRAMAASTATVTAFLSYAGDPNVCSSDNRFGPFGITGDIGSGLTSQTSSASPTDAMIDISSTATFEICLVFVPPINAYLTVSNVAIDLEECNETNVEIANTTWSGTYSCNNFGIDDIAGNITIDITRNDDGSYHYSDGHADYDGHLCGNKFKHNGGVTGSYTESGTLILNSDGSGSKTSTWNSVPPGSSGGTCTDVLTRV